MAKMFYTLEETAERLGKSVDDVQSMASSGELQEFRDGDKLVFKRDQIDLIAGPADGAEDADDSMIPLVDSAELEPLSLSSSGSGSAMEMENPKEQTGISIFDADELDDDDAAAQTQVTSGLEPDPEFMAMDSASSGSGLLELTREADDTSLGADLLDDVYSDSGESGEIGQTMPAGADANLFETGADTGADLGAAPAAVTILSAEAYDGKGSAWVGTMCVAMIVVIALGVAVTVLAMISQGGNAPAGGQIEQFGDKWMMIAGGAAALVIIPPLIAGLLKRK